MASSGLSSLKRSWSGKEDCFVGVEVAPLRNSSQQEKAEMAAGAPREGEKLAPINLSTPSPEKKILGVRTKGARFHDLENSTEVLGQGAGVSKRKLPASFNTSEATAAKFGFKSASQLKSEGVKTAFYQPGGGSRASTTVNSFGGTRITVGKLFLSKEQRVVHERVVKGGKNMFFTGSAGTGKSVVLREIIKGLRALHSPRLDAVAVTASTGIAACNIGGVTLHSFAGCGLGLEPAEQLVSKIKKNRKAASRWMRTCALIIDEISMVDPEFLDKLDRVGQMLRKSPKPFGGIQVVMTGDFFQLPPVTKGGKATRYAFDATCWNTVVQDRICLTQVFRQKDPDFINMLNEMRFGTLSAQSIRVFQSLTGQSEMEKESKMPATALYPLRQEVERANAEHLVKITHPTHTFEAIDGGTLQGEQRTKALDNFMAPNKLRLKVRCQVMLIKNIDESLVNGSIGTVLTFLAAKDYNKAQYGGMNWDDVDVDKMTEEDVFKQINAKYWDATNGSSGARREESGEVDEEMAAMMSELQDRIAKEDKKEKVARSRSSSPEKAEPTKYPIVRFLVAGGRYRTMHVTPEVWKNEHPNGEVVASRTQVPLILAWAMSIHKSQGQTIPIVKIDLGKVFEKGQAYVALSRAVSKRGLQVLNFDPAKVRADPRVIEWYKSLPTID